MKRDLLPTRLVVGVLAGTLGWATVAYVLSIDNYVFLLITGLLAIGAACAAVALS